VDYDVGQIEEEWISLEASVVYDLLVSEQPKLHRSGPPEGQPAADATFDGPQSRMASLNPSVPQPPVLPVL